VSDERMLVSEIIGNNLRTRESIRYGESEGKTFREIIDAATAYGWHSFDHCLISAFEANEITEETALLYCSDKARVRRDLDTVKKRREGGQQLDLESGLKLEIRVPEPTINYEPGETDKRRVSQPRPPSAPVSK